MVKISKIFQQYLYKTSKNKTPQWAYSSELDSHLYTSGSKFNSYGGFWLEIEFISCKAWQEVTLTNSRVTNKDHWNKDSLFKNMENCAIVTMRTLNSLHCSIKRYIFKKINRALLQTAAIIEQYTSNKAWLSWQTLYHDNSVACLEHRENQREELPYLKWQSHMTYQKTKYFSSHPMNCLRFWVKQRP